MASDRDSIAGNSTSPENTNERLHHTRIICEYRIASPRSTKAFKHTIDGTPQKVSYRINLREMHIMMEIFDTLYARDPKILSLEHLGKKVPVTSVTSVYREAYLLKFD